MIQNYYLIIPDETTGSHEIKKVYRLEPYEQPKPNPNLFVSEINEFPNEYRTPTPSLSMSENSDLSYEHRTQIPSLSISDSSDFSDEYRTPTPDLFVDGSGDLADYFFALNEKLSNDSNFLFDNDLSKGIPINYEDLAKYYNSSINIEATNYLVDFIIGDIYVPIPESEFIDLNNFSKSEGVEDHYRGSKPFKTTPQPIYVSYEIPQSEYYLIQEYIDFYGSEKANLLETTFTKEVYSSFVLYKTSESIFIELRDYIYPYNSEKVDLKETDFRKKVQNPITPFLRNNIQDPEIIIRNNTSMGVENFRTEIRTIWEHEYPKIDQTMTVIDCVTFSIVLVKWIVSKFGRLRTSEKVVRVLLSKDSWNLPELSEKLRMSTDATRALLKAFSYKWDKQRMLYCKTQQIK